VKQTLPDEASDEYPEMRKGHALIKYGNMVYIYGGIHLPNPANTPENILNDIWRLNLDDFRWFKMPTKLPEAVFFHSGAVTSVSS
jgi:N-acetylneuraminic acid mutarotase